jgi:transcriptional regulator
MQTGTEKYMYIPKHFEEKDKATLIKFMREYNFATLVNYAKKKPWATHLPFIILEEGENIILKAHMAKANPQWPAFRKDENVLVIFQEPHAYISPKLYENKVSVPTWNYAAVHAYGVPKILESVDDRIKLLELSFEHFDPSYKEQWKTLPDDYRNDLLNGITAFEIIVTKLEGKFKLSQNRTEGDRSRIVLDLASKRDKTKADIARLMEEQKNKSSKTLKKE